jgi:hypothetical protein
MTSIYSGLIVNTKEGKCIKAPQTVGEKMGVAACDPADTRQIITIKPWNDDWTRLLMNTTATGSDSYGKDWKGEIHEWDQDLYWGGPKPSVPSGSFLNPIDLPGEHPYFLLPSLEEITDPVAALGGKFAIHERSKAGNDVTLQDDGRLTHQVGSHGTPASTWLPYSLWEKCKAASILVDECSKSSYNAYLNTPTAPSGDATTAPSGTGGTGGYATTAAPRVLSYWDQEIWGLPRWSLAAAGGTIGCVIVFLLCILLIRFAM